MSSFLFGMNRCGYVIRFIQNWMIDIHKSQAPQFCRLIVWFFLVTCMIYYYWYRSLNQSKQWLSKITNSTLSTPLNLWHLPFTEFWTHWAIQIVHFNCQITNPIYKQYLWPYEMKIFDPKHDFDMQGSVDLRTKNFMNVSRINVSHHFMFTNRQSHQAWIKLSFVSNWMYVNNWTYMAFIYVISEFTFKLSIFQEIEERNTTRRTRTSRPTNGSWRIYYPSLKMGGHWLLLLHGIWKWLRKWTTLN